MSVHAVNLCKLATLFANHIADVTIDLSIYKCNVLYCPYLFKVSKQL